MTVLDIVGTLLFLAFVLAVLALLAHAGALLVRRRSGDASRTLGRLALLLGAYVAVVALVALAMPRHERQPGAPLCFDDWCVSARQATPAPAAVAGCPSGSRAWLVTLEVSSRAQRVTQRELAARAYAEDGRGRRYEACAPALPAGGRVPTLHDPVAPGDSFALTLPFALPQGVAPAGLVVLHPYTPGVLILGGDEALLHSPTLLRLPR